MRVHVTVFVRVMSSNNLGAYVCVSVNSGVLSVCITYGEYAALVGLHGLDDAV